jgi:hypothetical protein
MKVGHLAMALDTTGSVWPSAPRIAGNTRANVKARWLFTVLWNVVSAPVLVYIPPELARQPVAAIGFLFPLVGAGLLCWSVITTARAKRFGDTWLDTSSPARAGHPWHATLRARLPLPGGSGYTVTVRLTCLSRTVSRSGDDQERETILWREETEIDASRLVFGPDGAEVPVHFDIPFDARPTTASGKGAGILWVLTAEAALPGVNLREDFDVPVQADASSTGEARLASVVPPPDGAMPSSIDFDALARSGIRVNADADGLHIRFAPARNVSFATVVTGFTALFAGALWVQWRLGFPWIFPFFTALVDLLLLYVTVELWLGTTSILAGNGELRVRHTLLGCGSSRTLFGGEIAAIDLHIGMQTQGRYGTPYYDVRARLKSGRKVTLGSGVRNKRHAEWLAAQMRAAANVKEPRA